MNVGLMGFSTTEMVLYGGVLAALLLVVAGAGWWLKRGRRGKINTARYTERWQEAQKFLSSESTWPLAIINADKLLDDALRCQHYKGKTMGERLVKAQRDISDNDGVWFAHKLRNKLVHEDMKKLKKKDVMEAMVGIRSALKDMGALR